MSGFALEPDAGLVSPGELAALVARADGRARGLKGAALETFVAEHTPTDQTIRNYARENRVPSTRGPHGRFLFDPAIAVEAVRANRPERKHGGKRRNAGRKARTATPDRAFRQAADYRATIDRVTARAKDGVRPLQALPAEALLNLTADELKIILGHADAAGIGQACLDRLETLLKIQALERKQAVENGRLLEADAALKAWSDAQRAARLRIDQLPARVADRVAQAAWVSPEAVDRLAKELAQAGVSGGLIDRLRETLAPPAELHARVRAVIADEVRGVCERIAGG